MSRWVIAPTTKRIWMLLPLFLVLSGCSDDKLILERLGFIQIAGYDKGDDGKIMVTYSIPLVTFDAKQNNMRDEALTVTVDSIKGAKREFAQMSSRILVNGHIRAMLFSTDFAREGLLERIDTIMRDPTMSKRASIAVTERIARDIVKFEFPRHSKTGRYIDRLLQKEFEKQITPEIRVHQFLRDLHDESRDPIATVLNTKGNNLKVDGIALFDRDKYVGKVSPADTCFFMMMYQNQSKGEFTLDINSEDIKTIAFTASKSTRKIKISKDSEGQYKADIYIKAEAALQEYIGPLKLSKPADNRTVERAMSEYIVKQSERMIRDMQSKRADALGIGTYYRNKVGYAEWKRSNWHDVYSKLPVTVHCDFRIKSFGSLYD